MKQNEHRVVYQTEGYGYENEDLPTNPEKFMKFFQDKLNQIPKEFKENGYIEISSTHDRHDYDHIEVKIGYTRPETDDEERNRLERMSHHLAIKEAKEMEEFKRLQDKYGKR